jgi:hypothetical protein
MGLLCFEAMHRTATSEWDDALLSDLLAPPPLEDCRASVAFWRARLAGLPRHRLADRREARAMVARWEARLCAAEAAALPAPVRWARSARRFARRAALATAIIIGAWIVTFWLLLIVALAAVLD